MLKPNLRSTYVIGLFSITLLFISCATSSRVSHVPGEETIIVTGKNIFVLPASIRYESLESEVELSPDEYRGSEVAVLLMQATLDILSENGFNVQHADTFKFSDAKIYQKVLDQRQEFFRSSLAADPKKNLDNLGATCDYPNILVLDLKVQVGPGGSWNPLSGGIKSGMSYSRIRAVLIDTKSGNALWKSKLQLREIPDPTDQDFIQSINLLYKNLKRKET